ncbi:hypothetical protein CYJ73_21220 [Gordonia terrae]|uniref:Uncharacterized protein n=1 Tax=Gordonia terrae TaxID=2055 RepID=A0A2I1R379_9ACTN|nr:hypothetical protein [Gordonia terrae]PKZ63585.1 hypothetical protein CYJ73_21220 [Gordonia terrae]
MTEQLSLPQLQSWLDAAIAVVVTAGGLLGFAAVSFTEPWQSAVTMLLIGVGTALTVLLLVAVGWDRRHLLRPATVWLATLAVWVNAVVSVSGALYIVILVTLTALVLARRAVRHQEHRTLEVVTS